MLRASRLSSAGIAASGSSRLRCTPLAAEVLGAAPHQYWPTFSSYKEAWYHSGSGVNMGFLQAHGPLRSMVLGEEAHRAATRGEIAKMASLLEESLERGAWGPPPASTTNRAKAPGAMSWSPSPTWWHAIIASWPSTCAVRSAVVESLDEMLDIARAAACALEVSHLKAIGKDNQSLVGALWSASTEQTMRALCRLRPVPVPLTRPRSSASSPRCSPPSAACSKSGCGSGGETGGASGDGAR